MNTPKDRSDKLIIFTRYPVPGNAKTRLINDIGPAGAADVHRKLTEKIIAEIIDIKKKRVPHYEICYTGGSLKQMKNWLGNGFSYTEQDQGDLGARMYSAIKKSLHNGSSKVVLIGTDIPEPVSEFIDQTFSALDENDIVLGPATDGGYWLIGMKRPCNIFDGVSWGKETVLCQTVDMAKQHGCSVYQLPPVNDIDTVDDLLRWDPKGEWKNPFISVIIPVFNEEAGIEKTIERVKNKDAEVVVVDGGSADGTITIAEKLRTKVIKSSKRRSIQMNTGALLSKGNNLLFLHADTMVPENYISLIFEALMDKKSVAGAFQFRTDMDNTIMRYLEYMVNLRSGFLKLPYGDQGIFISKADFVKAGGYPDVPVAEDIFFIRRVKKSAKVRIIPEYAITSSRRWKNHGFLKTTFVNAVIFFGCYLGIKPEKLYTIYKRAWR